MDERNLIVPQEGVPDISAEQEIIERAKLLAVENIGKNIFAGVTLNSKDASRTRNLSSIRGANENYPDTKIQNKMDAPASLLNFSSGDVVLLETLTPRTLMTYEHDRFVDYPAYNFKNVIAGVIDYVTPEGEIFLKRAIFIRSGKTVFHTYYEPGSGVYEENHGLPLSEIVGASIVKASDPLAVFYERQLYQELIKKAQREHGVVKEFDPDNLGTQLLVTATEDSLLEINSEDLTELSSLETQLQQLIDGGTQEIYQRKKEELEGRIRNLEKQIKDAQLELQNFPNEEIEAIERAKFQFDLVKALKLRAARVSEIKAETKERKSKMYDLLTKYGFRPELVHPHFFLYVKNTILGLAKMDILPENITPIEVSNTLQVEIADLLDMFSIPQYGRKISLAQALFLNNIEDILKLCGTDTSKRELTIKKLKRVYAQHVHPDHVIDNDKDLATRLFQVGFDYLDHLK